MNARELRHHHAVWMLNAAALKNCHDQLVQVNAPITMLTAALRAAEYAADVAQRLDEWAAHEEQSG